MAVSTCRLASSHIHSERLWILVRHDSSGHVSFAVPSRAASWGAGSVSTSDAVLSARCTGRSIRLYGRRFRRTKGSPDADQCGEDAACQRCSFLVEDFAAAMHARGSAP